MRLSDRCGRVEDIVASREDASSGIGYAASDSSVASSFAFFLRLCGSTSSAGVVASSSSARCRGAGLVAAIELCNCLLESPIVSLSAEFVQK
jgi:hypothetical protein